MDIIFAKKCKFFGGNHIIIWEEHVFLTSTGARCIHHVATMGAGAEEVVIRPHYLDHYQHANDHQNNINWTLIQPQMQMTIKILLNKRKEKNTKCSIFLLQ